jgi:hypothetical protein
VATNYPTSLDADSTVGGGVEPDSATALDDSTSGHPTHSGLHKNLGDAVQQVETKLGIGSSTPSANKVLGCASGATSAWTDSPSVANLTLSADLTAVNATLSGNLNGVDPDNFANMTESTNAGRKITVSTSAPTTGQTTGDLWVNIS